MSGGYQYTLGQRFMALAARQPEAEALRLDGARLSYGALDRLANRIVALLRRQGVGRRDVVCLLHRKSPEGYAALLACLKLGAVFVHLDDQNPPRRLARILDRCRPRLVLADAPPPAHIVELCRPVAVIDLSADALAGCSDEPILGGGVTGADPAYIMFTSGSTGEPKGAVMSHGNVLSFADWTAARFALGPGEVVSNLNPVHFDNSVFDIFGSLMNGAALAPFSREVVAEPRALVAAVAERRCTVWFSVPSLLIYLLAMRVLTPGCLPDLRRIVFGGEGFPLSELKKLHGLFDGRASLVNVYGPTECTCICSAYDITAADFDDLRGLPPLGEVCDNFSRLILDEDGHPAAAGETGELCLLGPNVGLGYYNDPDRTAAAFVANPLNAAWHERMYRTGDLVRLDERGRLRFAGRKDGQIKHMGYRIELEEIEAALNALPYVDQAAVVYHRTRPGYGHIIGYVATGAAVSEQRLRDDLKAALPPYMLPNRIVFSHNLPKNANGKVDRVGLAEMAAGGGQCRVS